MTGRAVILAILLFSLAAGGAMYWLQVYAYYEEVAPEVAEVQFTPLTAAAPTALAFENYRGIDSDSSPLRYRACFEVDPAALVDARPYDGAEPLIAPGWFECFDAGAIDADLESGEARAYLAIGNFRYGFDRVIAVYPDGRAYNWHQMNTCGAATFAGNPAPTGCPPAPESF